ncbi:MAG: 4-(cytidine 5'-diphospho)-2-C-methyl-D-erythritol kinase [Chlamydiales bacterium]|nr:4-(cytidine 5'-diphospho)-2-C-methyl-D-erythritol kinase [Chlamydiales bacterium]
MVTFFSPAKLNLFLKVVKKRPDGYHELASLFQAVSLGDYIHVSLAEKDSFKVTGPLSSQIPLDPSNLVLKALSLFRKKSNISFAVQIMLEKHVPIQAGLGGGSSNAATMLWALNELLGFPVSDHDLITWSQEIGSDTTFFLSQGTAYCTGRGEIIQPLPCIVSQGPVYIIKPTFGLSTPLVFKALNLNELSLEDPVNAYKKFLDGSSCYFNDLEKPAFFLEPSLVELKQSLLQSGFSHALMTGSGTSFFAIGNGVLPKGEDNMVYPVGFIRREVNKWYEDGAYG